METFSRMQDFFKSQYDYIYFFYGFSFILMAAICYTLGREKPRAMPWLFLAAFSLIHGVHEWAELAVIYCGDSRNFAIIRLVLLTVSYTALLEFARNGLPRIFKITCALLFYISFIWIVWHLPKIDISHLNITARYMLGIPAGLLSVWAIYRAGRRDKKSKIPLFFLAVFIALHTITSGMIVPKSMVWPSVWINAENFIRIFGMPVQLIRGVLMLCAAIAVWFYSQSLPEKNLHTIEYHIIFKPSKWVIAVTMVTLIFLGWLLTDYLDYYASTQIIKSSKADVNSPINILNRELTKLEWAVISMSTSSRLTYVLTLSEPRFLARSRRILEGYRKSYSALDCFITDAKGAIIASASYNPQEAASGKTCRDAPYFKTAMAGEIGHYFAQGAKNEERIYYISAPIKISKEGIFGVVVIKKMMGVKPILQYRLISIIITFFVSILAVMLFMIVKRRERVIAFAEEANRRLSTIDEMKNDFISIVSHELRTPLTAIKNAASLMSKGWPDRKPVNEAQKELLDIIMSNTNRQIRMISDLLDISKIEAGVISRTPELLDISRLADDVIASFHSQADEKGITLVKEFDASPGAAFADPEHIRRVLSNLVQNAIKFTGTGGKIKLASKKGPSEITIAVSDTGVGMDEDDLGKLFNKFYRTDYASRNKDGSGLGLAISKGLIEANGGKISAESELGRGSAFYFTIPLSAVKDAGETTAMRKGKL